jgi:hypothetical protein
MTMKTVSRKEAASASRMGLRLVKRIAIEIAAGTKLDS